MLGRSLPLTVVGAFLLAPLPALSQVTVEERLAEGQAPVVAPNRSVRLGGFPENSLAGLEYAIERGIEMVHVNPQLTGDGSYVLMHDNTLNRTTDVEQVYPDGPPGGPSRSERSGKDYVRDYTLEEIRKLRLTDGEDGGVHKVPTLEEALDVVDGRVLMRLGLKVYEVESLSALLAARDTGNVLLFDVFYYDYEVLNDIAEATGLATAVSMTGSRNPVSDLQKLATGVGPTLRLVQVRSKQLTPEFVSSAKELGIRHGVTGWKGGEDPALKLEGNPGPWEAALASDPAALMTHYPELLLDLLAK